MNTNFKLFKTHGKSLFSSKSVVLFFVIAVAICFHGCAAQTKIVKETEYVYVSTPVPREAQMPQKPVLTNNPVETNLNILYYIKELEIELEKCLK